MNEDEAMEVLLDGHYVVSNGVNYEMSSYREVLGSNGSVFRSIGDFLDKVDLDDAEYDER